MEIQLHANVIWEQDSYRISSETRYSIKVVSVQVARSKNGK